MQSLHRLVSKSIPLKVSNLRLLSSTTKSTGDDDWNSAWETAWLPDDPAGTSTATESPWEIPGSGAVAGEADAETKAFVEEMNENWEDRRGKKSGEKGEEMGEKGLYSMENMKRDYRLKKQRVHAGLWAKEIERLEEAKLGGDGGDGDGIEKLLDSCSEIFDSPSDDLSNAKIPSSSEFKNKPDGWETTTKSEDGSVWEMSQREEDILVQEFERRMAFCKFQIASFIKTHIFSRRRPIDGWKYMIEEIGPNARKGKGSVSRLPSLADPATQPFREEKTPIGRSLTSLRGR